MGEWECEWALRGEGNGRNGKDMIRNGNDRSGYGGRTWEWAVRGGRNGKGRTRNRNSRTENGGRTHNDRLPLQS
jgi:hypothetical protein